MSDGKTNPEGEVAQPKLSMFDVMFGSAENTNPEVTSEENRNLAYEAPEAEAEYEIEAEAEAETEDYDSDSLEVDAEEEPEETSPRYSVKIDGEEFEVTLEELRNGYQRQADYTRKSQSLAEQRKAYEANINAVQQERQQYAQVLGQMANAQNAELQKYQEIDWRQLKEDDPMEYMEKRLEFQETRERVAALKSEQQRVQQQTESEFMSVLQEKVQREAELLSKALPDYANPDANLRTELRNYALGLGFSPQDIDGITDHRVVLVLHKAMLQDKAEKGVQTQRKAKAVPKVVKPGTPESKTQRSNRALQAKRERLAKTGNTKDAANIFLDLIS